MHSNIGLCDGLEAVAYRNALKGVPYRKNEDSATKTEEHEDLFGFSCLRALRAFVATL